MRIIGNCKCKNLTVDWRIRDFSLIARACQCQYCSSKQAHWISKSGSRFSLNIRYPNTYQVKKSGYGLAEFHECMNCEDVVAASVVIDNKTYGAINAKCLSQLKRFPAGREVLPEKNQTDIDRQKMWQQNWCSPVEIITPEQTTKLRLIK